MAKLTVEQFIRKTKRQKRVTQDLLITALNRTTRILRRRVVEKHFSNNPRSPGARSVSNQSGKLAKSIRFSKAVPDGSGAASTMTIGTEYATTHVALNRRRKKRITAKRGMLAIPTDFARTARGVPIAPPLDPRWAPTQIIKNVIFGHVGSQRLPLFVLKKTVVVPQRISVARDIVKPGEDILKEQIRRETDKIL